MNKLRHKVKINVSDGKGEKQEVVSGTTCKLPRRILRFFLGELSDVMVITPGKSVEGIEIREVGEEDETV